MLSKIKHIINEKLEGLGKRLGKWLTPNSLTFLALITGLTSGFIYSNIHQVITSLSDSTSAIIAALLLLISGIFDGLDGLVARVNNLSSKIGSFVDSIADKVVEAAVFMGLIYGGYVSWEFGFLAAVFSLLISYARAKGETLGLTIQGIGLMERQERLLFIISLSIIYFLLNDMIVFRLGFIVFIVLVVITFIHRTLHIIIHIKNS